LHHFCQYFDSFEIKIGSADISALPKTSKALKKVAKRCNKGEKNQLFGTGLNLALVLNLIQSLIYPGATFSTVPVKRYECPSWTLSVCKAKIEMHIIACDAAMVRPQLWNTCKIILFYVKYMKSPVIPNGLIKSQMV